MNEEDNFLMAIDPDYGPVWVEFSEIARIDALFSTSKPMALTLKNGRELSGPPLLTCLERLVNL